MAVAQRLEDIYARPKGDAFFTGQDAAYAKAFADCGIDVTVLPFAEAAQRIRASRIRGTQLRSPVFFAATER